MDPITIIRTLIGDPAGASQFFTDAQITTFLTLAGVNITPVTNAAVSGTNDTQAGVVTEYFFAASQALGAMAAKFAVNLQEVKIGDFSDSSGKNKITSLRSQADAYLKLYYETPAWAVAETGESDMNDLWIIRNYVLRTNP